MKKFSKITNSPVGIQPLKKSDEINESDFFKAAVSRLMDNFLKVQMIGPITRYHVAGTMTVAGKELFLEALVDMIGDVPKISKTYPSINESISSGKIKKSKEKIKSLYKRYKDDKELLLTIVDRNINSIKNGHTAYWRSVAAEDLSSESGYPREVLKEISRRYRFRADQLGFKNSI